MKQLVTKGTWFGFLSITLLLTACGGGGGGSSYTPPEINETPVAITTANQNDVTVSADESISGTTTGTGTPFGVAIDGGESSFSVFDFASTTLLDHVRQSGAANVGADLPAGVTATFSEPCESGNETITINITDPDSGTLIVGDSASITANNCTDFGTTTNGTFSMTVDAGSLFLGDCGGICADVTISVDFNNFRATTSGLTSTMHGDMTLAISEASDTASFSGTSLFIVEAGGDALHMSNFSVSGATVGVTTTSTVSMTIAGTLIDGSITIVTTDPLLQDEFDAHPHTGTIVVTGAGGATLTIVYIDPTQVELTLDTDGPGGVAAETPVIVAWADM